MIGVRKSSKVFGRGALTFIRPANRAVLAYVRELGDEAILCVANLSRSAQAVELDLARVEGPHAAGNAGPHRIPAHRRAALSDHAAAYGFYWFLLRPEEEHEPEKVLPREITTLVLGQSGEDALSSWTRRAFEVEVLPDFMPDRRWFADKASRPLAASISAAIRIEHADDRFAAVIADVAGLQGVSRYFLPLTIRWTRYTEIDRGPASVLAALRRGPREGTLLDATAEPEFIAALLAKIHAGETVGEGGAAARIRPTAAFAASALAKIETVKAIERRAVELDGDRRRQIRRQDPAADHRRHPSGDGGRRFLADVAHFENAPTLSARVELVEGETAARSPSCINSSKTRAMPGP